MLDKPTFKVIPFEGIGPIKFGMSQQEVRSAMKEIGQETSSSWKPSDYKGKIDIPKDSPPLLKEVIENINNNRELHTKMKKIYEDGGTKDYFFANSFQVFYGNENKVQSIQIANNREIGITEGELESGTRNKFEIEFIGQDFRKLKYKDTVTFISKYGGIVNRDNSDSDEWPNLGLSIYYDGAPDELNYPEEYYITSFMLNAK